MLALDRGWSCGHALTEIVSSSVTDVVPLWLSSLPKGYAEAGRNRTPDYRQRGLLGQVKKCSAEGLPTPY